MLASLTRLGAAWAGIAALATVLLYLFGYLSLRSHFVALGLDADLATLDDRYIFAGARFLVFLLAFLTGLAVPFVLGMGLVSLVSVRGRGERQAPDGLVPDRKVSRARFLPLLVAAGLSFVTAAFALQVLAIDNLLLLRELPEDFGWVRRQLACGLTADTPGAEQVLVLDYLVLVLLTAATSVWAWRCLHRREVEIAWLTALLVFLAAVQAFLLPIHHGVLFADTIVRRLERSPEAARGFVGSVWLVDRGNTRAMIFGRDAGGLPRLVPVPTDALNGIAVTAVTHLRTIVELAGCR